MIIHRCIESRIGGQCRYEWRHCRFRTWSPRLVITTAAIVTGVVGAPIARADTGADLGAPSQAGVAAGAALADAAAVPAVSLSENPVPAVPLPPGRFRRYRRRQKKHFNRSCRTKGRVPSCRPRRSELSPTSVPARPPPHRRRARLTRAPKAPAARGKPQAELPAVSEPGRFWRSRRIPRRGTALRAARARRCLHRSRAEDERATPGKQPIKSHSARPRERPDLDSGSEPRGQRGRHAGQRRGNRSPRQLSSPRISGRGALDDQTDHADTVGSPGESRDIGRDITGNAIDGSSDDRTQDANCDPHNGCCGVPSLAGGCCTSHCLPACV